MTTEVFSFKDPLEEQNLALDFSPDLDTGETLTSIVDSGIEVYAGTDASPSSVLNGAASIVGAAVVQPVKAGTHMVDYRVWVRALTSGGRKLVVAGILPVRNA